ncbi:30S ribosomal protein S11 [Candidatus Parcubacteria bacterium]|nr:30S ribosomal protein S11 [Candidatus Parcubacteria bacterium]
MSQNTSQHSNRESGSRRKPRREVSQSGCAYIAAGFNNTLITITDDSGAAVCQGSSGLAGFKGSRKSTPYAASLAAENVGRRAVERGVRGVAVFVKGPGSGRNAAVKSLRSAGLRVTSITDVTPIPHNGCRPKKRRRI